MHQLQQFCSDLDETLWGSNLGSKPPQPPFHPHSVVDPSAFQICMVVIFGLAILDPYKPDYLAKE